MKLKPFSVPAIRPRVLVEYNLLATCPHVALTLLLLFLSTPLCAQNFALPEVICYIRGTPEDSTEFGREFCWVGDQNGDGYDDLLVNHDPFDPSRENRYPHPANQVELFYGGENMNDEPDMIFRYDVERWIFGQSMSYIGNLIPDVGSHFVIYGLVWDEQERNILQEALFFYKGNESLDNEFDNQIRTRGGEQITIGQSHHVRPFDYNGDGYDDIIARKRTEDDPLLYIYFGGAEFDTLPDWVTVIPSIGSKQIDYSIGYDINSDGYGDIFVRFSYRFSTTYRFQLYLGGNPPDTIPALSFDHDTFEPRRIQEGFSLLPDVNGDGYDDFGVHFLGATNFTDGYFLFFGSEEPDSVPDVTLSGNHAIMDFDGDISGGDFNGDGYGDIVTGLDGGFYLDGEIHLYFGHPGLPEEWEADIVMNGLSDYGVDYDHFGENVGAIGDYNGDGIDDFVTRVLSGTPSIVIFAGSSDWRVDVREEPIAEKITLTLKAYPNPFNSTTTLSFDLPTSSAVHLTIYNLSGQEVVRLADSVFPAGTHSVTWTTEDVGAGVYFAMLKVDGDATEVASTVQKLVVVK